MEFSSGYIKTRLDPEPAMFQRTPIQINFAEKVTHMKVCSGFLVYVEGKQIRRKNLHARIDEKDDIEFSRDEDVSEIFMDPSGNHVIIAMKSETNYYLHRTSKTMKQLSKFNGKLITAVAWNLQQDSAQQYTSTGPIIVATSKGLLFETVLNASEDSKFKISFSSSEQYFKQLYDLGGLTVSGIAFGKVTTNQRKSQNVFVIVATSCRLYQFFGELASTMEGSIFCNIFDQYKDIEDIKYIDLPGDSGVSQLHTYQTSKDDPVKSFAWMATPGVICGRIDHTVTNGSDSVIVNHKLIPYEKGKDIISTDIPNSVVLTEFHLLMLFENKLRVICILNEEQVWEDMFDRKDNARGMCRDAEKGLVWIIAARGVYRYKIVDESRNVWSILLKMGEFDRAKAHCQHDPHKLDLINREQAKTLFNAGEYDKSAIFYAQTRMSFEEVTLKFIDAKADVALRTYLEKKLLSYKSAEDNVQMTMLVTWLVELWLNQLGKINDQIESDGHSHLAQEKEMLQEEFRLFLAKGDIRTCLQRNKPIVYDLIASHGDMDDLVFFADLMNDYEKVISHRLQNNKFEKAIEQLQKVGDPGLVYKFSPLLMQHVPHLTVDMWKSISTSQAFPGKPLLDPKKLIPALVQYEVKKIQPGQTHETIRFLEFCVRNLKNRDQAIHNYLISLYAVFDQDKLLKYLKVQGQDAQSVNYDLKYALRLCSEKSLHEACVHIYSTMGLYSEAVNLALTTIWFKFNINNQPTRVVVRGECFVRQPIRVQGNLVLAQENANKPEDDDERRKLWLDVARHVVEQQKDIDQAMKVLKNCDLLKIEDILPFFPDFVTIDKFKEAITQSLTDYNEHINSLKESMDEATESADQIRNQIQEFRKKSGCVRSTDVCAICTSPLVTRSFYLFPCEHKFHTDCLISEVLPTLMPHMRAKVEDLQRRVAAREDTFSIASTSSQSQMSPKRELDELVASECLYCGELIIRTIDEPFITAEEYSEGLANWN